MTAHLRVEKTSEACGRKALQLVVSWCDDFLNPDLGCRRNDRVFAVRSQMVARDAVGRFVGHCLAGLRDQRIGSGLLQPLRSDLSGDVSTGGDGIFDRSYLGRDGDVAGGCQTKDARAGRFPDRVGRFVWSWLDHRILNSLTERAGGLVRNSVKESKLCSV